MIKRTIEISRDRAHLAVRNEQLLIQRDGETVGQVPCEDIGVLLVDHPAATYSHHALTRLAASDAAVVICGKDHLPSAMLLPLSNHTQVVWRLRDQLDASLPLKKRLWKQLVQEKVRAQAANLPDEGPAKRKLLELAKLVRSGDPKNIEAQAAKIYWGNWLWQEEFRRKRHEPGLNSFLNYGYAIIRAAIARAIVGAGLLPSLGLHHRNRSNAFCLADDLIEPIRPLVDDRARELYRQGYEELTQEAKAALLDILTQRVSLRDQTGPLMVMLHRYAASLVRCYEGKAKLLEIPRLCSSAGTDVCGS